MSAQRDRLDSLLAKAPEESLEFWWRDDDATEPSAALEALLAIQQRHNVPIALAVIPKYATEALADLISARKQISIFQHGWQHKNHANKEAGERASEFGESRDLADSLADLQSGFDRTSSLFGKAFLPVLTPPWNRIGSGVVGNQRKTGLLGLSAFGQSDTKNHRVDGHIDVIDWKNDRVFVGKERAYKKVADAVEARLEGLDEPIGLLTHHLVHCEETNSFLDDLVAMLCASPAVHWPPLRTLFRLEP